jgi:hypothetical protein
MKRREHEVVLQLSDAGYLDYFLSYSESEGETLMGVIKLEAIEKLRKDARFANGIFYGLHRNVGNDLIDFRGYNGTFGVGSLQLVCDKKTGATYADIDAHNPYEDVVRLVGHTGELVRHLWRRIWR